MNAEQLKEIMKNERLSVLEKCLNLIKASEKDIAIKVIEKLMVDEGKAKL